jgi:beta-galactosidase
MKTSLRRILLLAALACGLSVLARAADAPRERLRFDSDWRFHLGNEWGLGQNLAKAATGFGPASTSFSDASWRRVDLPHDWAIELPFDPKADTSHGFKALGEAYPQNSVGWYRRTFTLPAGDAGRRIWLEFDGVYRDSTVFVNGWCLGREESGYSNFRYDITDVANYGGENVVAVRVDATHPEGWFYEGAGIYRHVWLVKTGPVALAPDGIFVYPRLADGPGAGPAEVEAQAEVTNQDGGTADVTVAWEVLDPSGRSVGTAQQDLRVATRGTATAAGAIRVTSPALWSPETPRLYRLVTTVRRGEALIDREETEFGLRTFGFDPEKGFLLNGQPYVLKGTCNHQDHAGVGAALPDAVQYFRIARLKEMGGNAYRTSHNPPTPELLQACDRLGMLVMDENRLLGSDPTRMDRWARLIRRDRNHASVAIWSIANEEFTAGPTIAGGRVAATMQAFVQSMDSTRPVTYAAPVGNDFTGINAVIQVRGWNYHVGPDMDAYHAAHPQQPNVGTEQGSTVSTRGIYANDKVRGYVSAYDDNAPSWATTAKTWWGYFQPRPWLSGGFVWTGFDYRGEPTPYAWPCISSHFGILDTCGFAKDNFWYYQSWWTTRPVLHLLPHWNWAGREGQPIDVRALSNCDEVELLLNGRSLGRQTMPRNGELKWSVPYAAGKLAAVGYQGGQRVTDTAVETTGAPAAVQLSPDRPAIKADGEDVAMVTVSITDANGRVVPTAGQKVRFELAGPGRILGVGNGDPSCHEPDTFVSAPVLQTVPVDGWKLKRGIDPYAATVPETAEKVDESGWAPVTATSDAGPLGDGERAAYRAHFTVTARQLEAAGVELWFGKIDNGVAVYVNGQKVGAAGDARSASVYNVKSVLRPGENTVAVTISSFGSSAGLSHGTALRFIEPAPGVQWSRSVFNGLAQVIVQGRRSAGELKLTATADGLKPVTLTIATQPTTLQPSVE